MQVYSFTIGTTKTMTGGDEMPKPIEPEKKEQIKTHLATCGNVRQTARMLGVSPATVMKVRDEDPDAFEQLRTDKKTEFINKSWELMTDGLDEMKLKMKEASYRDLATGIGIVTDKMLLLSGEATSRSDNTNKNTHDLGELTAEQAEEIVKAFMKGGLE